MKAIVTIQGKKFSCQVSESILSQSWGLRFSKKLGYGKGLLMNFKRMIPVAVDMLFVFHPLDIIWIDDNNTVVRVKNCAFPFVPYIRGSRCKYILEVQAGEAFTVQPGNKVTIKLLKNKT